MSKKIYITGVAATGKSTLTKEFRKRNIFAIAVDEVPGLCFWVNRKTQKRVTIDKYQGSREWLEAHEWTCDVPKLKRLLAPEAGLIIATGVLANQDEFLGLFDRFFLLKFDPSVMLQRIENRNQEAPGQFGWHLEERELLLRVYQDLENKWIGQGAVPIDANNPIDAVADKILSEIHARLRVKETRD